MGRIFGFALSSFFVLLLLTLKGFAENPQVKGNVPEPAKLCEFLVDVDGYSAGECDKMKAVGTPIGNLVKAEREYRQGDETISVIVLNGIMAKSSWAPFASNMEVDDDNNYVKITSINGYRCGINYEKKEKRGSIVIPLTDDIKNHPVSAIFAVNFENMSYKKAIDFIENFDLKSLVDLFQ
ncbi:hypothetical protein [Hippea maritima]|uniref:Uncharacterized protein n=1 Tax=Hippea maritima (strain ATCC 700847 / DSM 10411 / MH2) TaxID=760142 RepID=F2LWM9_HIPMA|nr:hypothetical protein [Hippea maritima]AEA34138.1 hypothetical protein Hipma_1176 [Hippea maritima DSM 10411]